VPSGRLFFIPSRVRISLLSPRTSHVAAVIKKAMVWSRKILGHRLLTLAMGSAIELHSKMNALGDDIVNLITQTLKPSSEIVANLKRSSSRVTLLTSPLARTNAVAARHPGRGVGRVEMAVRDFQNMTQAIKFCSRPVVVAPTVCALAVAWKFASRAARQPHAELYMGLVEAGVGLIPGGGGCKEMTIRSVEAGTTSAGRSWKRAWRSTRR